MTTDRVYITTAIPYVNAAPHLGFALELVLADTLARFHRQRGADVRFLSGTDENSLKNVEAARAAGVPVEAFVEENASRFRSLEQTLDLSFDDFIRTSADPRHRPGVEKLWRAWARRGDLYRKRYRGLYCLGCESFVDGACPDHEAPPVAVDEENWFFRLSRYQDAIVDLLETRRLDVAPGGYRNEVLAFARRGLEDVSVSRSRARSGGWGIPVPGDPDQVIYVWIDALANYISALGHGRTEADRADAGGPSRTDFDRWWRPPSQRLHVVGKGITRFHALYWPALLLSAGLPLPDRILVHGYLTLDGRKISKSGGPDPNLDPAALVRTFGTDTLRYHLLRHTRTHQDADFTRARLETSYYRELGDQLGNLLHRTVSLAARTGDGVFLPADRDASCIRSSIELEESVEAAVLGFRPNEALDEIFRVAARGNRYLEATEPWRVNDSRKRIGILSNAAGLLREVARHLTPFLPSTAARIASQIEPGQRATPGSPLFPRLSSESTDPAEAPRP